jgi:hypothetical protein
MASSGHGLRIASKHSMSPHFKIIAQDVGEKGRLKWQKTLSQN